MQILRKINDTYKKRCCGKPAPSKHLSFIVVVFNGYIKIHWVYNKSLLFVKNVIDTFFLMFVCKIWFGRSVLAIIATI